MTRTTLVAVAGLPTQILDPFTQGLVREHQNLRVFAALPLQVATTYSPKYLDELYNRVAKGLRNAPEAVPSGRWCLNFVLFFLDKIGNSTAQLLERFGLEALLVPIDPDQIQVNLHGRNQVNRSVNDLLHDARRQLHTVRSILDIVSQEVTVRDNRTCMLLPCTNYGNAFRAVSECVQGAVCNAATPEDFQAGLKGLVARLETDSNGYFKGKGGLVYRAPAKAGARHGIAPNWHAGNHTDRCVIRGHLRFGAAFEPNFHYDCELRKGGTRQFVSCHGNKTVKRGRSHVNIAPNDNVR